MPAERETRILTWARGVGLACVSTTSPLPHVVHQAIFGRLACLAGSHVGVAVVQRSSWPAIPVPLVPPSPGAKPSFARSQLQHDACSICNVFLLHYCIQSPELPV